MRKALSLIIALMLASPAQAGTFPEPRLKMRLGQALMFSDANPGFGDCTRLRDYYRLQGWPEGASVETLKAIDTRVKAKFTSRYEGRSDTWRDLSEPLLMSKRRVSGDCEDLALTSLVLARCAGFAADEIGLLYTFEPTVRQMHITAYFEDSDGYVWIFGDTMTSVRAQTQTRYEPIGWSPLAQLGKSWNWSRMPPLSSRNR